ncbi:ABC transporter, membrane protein [Geotalea daltonii FRC-32]|uniref:ABC transporter, membrane protein n=1 Tax=Geotalea daltonii (strain DSM 22248 / JCM 15807 / FRC-32) TaxID=316067 RepID=B9M066_GEODF|nr:ABC transporter permease [Geotalea daltonii]ACM20846.1 ABC transporter, membrane protein [Geotalea daltonii FRC-32]
MFKQFLIRSSGVIAFLLLWEIGPRLAWVDPNFLPSFSTVLMEIGKLFNDGTLKVHLLVSIWRATTGLLLALAMGLPLGLLLGRHRLHPAEAIEPLLRVLSQVNPFTLMPVFILFFGIGETAKVAVVAWVCLWPVLFYTITASRHVEAIQIKTAASMGISTVDMMLKVIVPGALPTIFVGIRIGACLTFYILVAAEMLGAGAGLGWLVHNSAMNYLIPRIYAGATFIVVLGFLLNRFLLYLERALFSWQSNTPLLFGSAAPPAVLRPGKGLVAAFTGALVLIALLGGIQVQKINREAATVSDGPHSHHSETGGHNGHSGF